MDRRRPEFPLGHAVVDHSEMTTTAADRMINYHPNRAKQKLSSFKIKHAVSLEEAKALLRRWHEANPKEVVMVKGLDQLRTAKKWGLWCVVDGGVGETAFNCLPKFVPSEDRVRHVDHHLDGDGHHCSVAVAKFYAQHLP